jgi:hypothetical protein
VDRSRDLCVLALLFCLGIMIVAPSAAAKPSKTDGANTQELETKSGEELVSLMRLNVKAIKAEAPSSKEEKAAFTGANDTKKMQEGLAKACNGDTPHVWVQSEDIHSYGCSGLARGFKNSGSTEKQFKALLLGCWWDTSVAWEAGNCVPLASALLLRGNVEAAKVVLRSADGCHSHNSAGDPINLCFAFAVQYQNLFGVEEMKSMALDAYNHETDPAAARYLSSMGISADVAGAEEKARLARVDAHQADLDQREANDAAAAERRQQSEARQAAILGALQSMPGSTPNSIQQAANQQEANMRATGDANAAAQQQAANARIAAQQAARAQQFAAQQAAATQLAAQQQAAQQRPTQTAPQSTNPPGGGCSPVDYLVKATSDWRTGPAAMDHEVVASFTNNATFTVSCTLHFHKNGVWDSKNGSGFDLASGSTISGESGGLWTIGADSAEVQYICYQKNAADTQGNICSDLPW